MRKTIKLFSILCIIAGFTSCDESSDLGFEPTPETGWVQIPGDGYYPAIIESHQSLQEIIRVGVDIQVPTTSSDLTISYNLVSVSGLDPNINFSNSGSIVSPAGETGYMGPDNNTGINYVYLPTIDLDVAELPTLTEAMIFDVVLTATSSSSISVGFNDEKPISQRISICPSFDAASGNLLGDYVLTVPTGAGPFGVVFEDDQVVSITEGNNGPFSRVFEADYLPAIGAGNPVVPVEFLLVDGGDITVLDGIASGLGCASEILLNGDPGNISASPCGDSVIILNLLDFAGGSGDCGVGDVPVTIVLTKV